MNMEKKSSSYTLVLFAALLVIYFFGFFSAYYLYGLIPANSQNQTPQNLVPQDQNNLLPLEGQEVYSAEAYIAAVKQQGEVGVLSKAVVEIHPGKGRILFNTNPFVEPDTQQSIETAAKVAEAYTKKSLEEKDVIYSIEESDAKLIGGPSAGASLTIATIAAIEQKQVNPNIVMTGTIEADWSIGKIGGQIEKMAAVEEAGKELFLVPTGQSTITFYEQQVREQRQGNFVIQRAYYVPKTTTLQQIAEDQNWNIQVKEVGTIQEAVELMIE